MTMIVSKQNWFDALDEALASEGLTGTWDNTSSEIPNGETVSYHATDSFGQNMYISVYRNADGRFERPFHYIARQREEAHDA